MRTRVPAAVGMVLAMALTSPLAASAQEHWCWNADAVDVTVVDADVKIAHRADLVNCCPDPFTFDIAVGDVTIFVEEHSQSPCDCDCCYDVDVTIADAPPGPWILRYSWFDIETGEWTDQSVSIEVPDLGQGYEPHLGEIVPSGCLDPAAIPDPPPTVASTWGTIKSRYR